MSHARLLDIAIREFGAKGLEGASTRGIAAAAGTAMSAITYHFGGKEGLYRAAASHIAETMGAEFVTVLAECEAAPAGPEAARTCVHRLLDHFAAKLIGDDHADWSLFIMREQMEPTAAFDCFYDGPMGRMMQRLAVHVAAATGVADGAARIAALTMFGQVVVFRASRALTLRLMQIDALDDRIAQELRRRIGANTDAILDQMTAERQEPQ